MNSKALKRQVGLDQEIKVVSNRAAVGFCVVGAAVLAGVATIGFARSPTNPGAFVMSLFALVGVAGALLFIALGRASRQLRTLEDHGEKLLAEGQGRIDGQLTAVAVGATDQRIVAIRGRVIGTPNVIASIPYRSVLKFRTAKDSLFVRGQDDEIALVKCPAPQVTALSAELRSRVPD